MKMKFKLGASDIAFCISFVVYVAIAIGFAVGRQFAQMFWCLIATYWSLLYFLQVKKTDRLRSIADDMAKLVFTQHEYMKRRIQDERRNNDEVIAAMRKMPDDKNSRESQPN